MGTWIPVTVQIPKDFERVLIWWRYRGTDDEGGYGFGYQVEDMWYGDARGIDREVLAWMPLPPRYDGGEQA
jgi:hypothetical protein